MTLQKMISLIIMDDAKHAKFLNTLSFMENAGARKISASEHPETVTTMILKHAAEEHRHAYYLKKQIQKIAENAYITFAKTDLIAANESCHYLNKLDILTSRYLKRELALSGSELKYAAYLFVTYAIELRADELYPIYQSELTQSQSKVTVKSIILEEVGHLEEMVAQLVQFSNDWEIHANKIVTLEKKLYTSWIFAIQKDLA